ncbi:MAG: hypothetical protein J2P36_16155, partial [Ktedonobacteraceae bacterium]|nr:hypothetical protein [Ktedonobacteraceae bacterium]
MFYIPEARHFILGESHVTSRSFLRIISLPWLSRVISPKAGICQEIFRNGTYILSVGPNFKGPRPKVRKGDYIYYISLAPRAYSFSGAMVTKDGAQRSYDMHIELKVVSSTRFIEMYDNKQDPARQIFMQFKQTFEYYVSKMGDAAKGTIDPWLDRQVAMLSQEYGIQVIHPTWFFHTDDNKSNPTEQEDIEQAAQQRKREIEMEYDLKAYEEHIKLDMEEGLERRKRDFMREKTG